MTTIGFLIIFELEPGHQGGTGTRTIQVASAVQLQESVAKLLEDLNLMQYYLQKLTFEDVINITEDKFNEKPKNLSELPWYFVKHIIGLDSTTRENCHIEERNGEEDNSQEEKEEEEEDEDDDDDDDDGGDDEQRQLFLSEVNIREIIVAIESNNDTYCPPKQIEKFPLEEEKEEEEEENLGIHPLDLIYATYLCA